MKTQPTTHLSRHFALCLQAWRLVRTQPVLAAVSVLGTAFAIAMIMVIVLTWQLKYSDVYPETHRSRTLFVSALGLANRSYGYSSALFMRDCVEGLPGVETCTAYSFASDALVTLPAGSGQRLRVDAKQIDPEFWRVFPFRFVSGTGFSQADFESGRPSAVLCESVARRLFGRTDVAGEYIVLNRSHMRVAGVVPDVSLTARDAYAQLWWLYPYSERHTRGDYTTYLGNMTVAMLVSSRDSMQAVRAGVQRRVKLLNEGAMKNTPLWIGDQPDDIRTHLNHVWANVGPDMTMFYAEHALLLLLVLLVPALNLSGLNHSRMQQRCREMGVRKAFGATRLSLVLRMLRENMLLTLAGGLVGLALSYLALYLLRGWLFFDYADTGSQGQYSLSLQALFSPTVFLLAFLFCFVINVLSATVPALVATRQPIAEALNGK